MYLENSDRGYVYNAVIFSGEFTNKQDIAVLTFITNGSRVYNHMERPGYSSDDMALETRYILYEFYKPFNQALARLLNDSRFDYGPC